MLLYILSEVSVLSSILHTLTEFNIWSILARLLLATLIGGLIGAERGRHGRAAGLRTHILVCLGSAMAVLAGLYSVQYLGLSGDPLRIAAQVVSGIGFLGAGTILTRSHAHITGLTTAAGLWATACLGLAAGVGFYLGALIGAFVVILTITVFTRLERGSKNLHFDTYYLELDDLSRVNEFAQDLNPAIASLQVVPAKSGITSHIGLELVTRADDNSAVMMEHLRSLDYVLIAIPVAQWVN